MSDEDADLIAEEEDVELKSIFLRRLRGDKVSRQELQEYVEYEQHQREVFLNLPFTLLYFCVFVTMILMHENLKDAGMVNRVFRNMLSGTTYEGIAYTSGHKDIEDIATKEDVWTFMREVVMGIYINPLQGTPPEDRYRVLRYNQIVGGVMLQQLRREKVTCSTEYPKLGPFPVEGAPNPMMASFQCYPWYTESQECFGNRTALAGITGWCPDAQRSKEISTWPVNWNSVSGAGGRLLQSIGRRLDYYPEGGGTGGWEKGASSDPGPEQYYNVYFHEYEGQEAAVDVLTKLEEHGWIDLHTSWVGVRALIFNPDLAMFAHVTTHIYFPPSGRLRAHITIQSITPEPYQYKSIIAIDATFLLLLLWFTIRTGRNLMTAINKKAVGEWLRNVWTYIDIFSVLGGFVAVMLAVILMDKLQTLKQMAMDVRLAEPVAPITLEAASNYELLVGDLHYNAISLSEYLMITQLLLCWYTIMSAMKFLQAFSAQPRLAVITETLLRAQEDIIHFLIVWFIVFCSFVVAAMFLFGRKYWEYSSLWHSFMSCFRMMLGDYDFDELVEENPFTGAVWFWLFVVVIVFVTLNIAMAIIMDTYTEVKGEASETAYIWDTVANMITETRDSILGRAPSNLELIDKIRGIPDEDVNVDLLMRYGGPKLSAEKARELIDATKAREDRKVEEGQSISSGMKHIGWIKIICVRMTQALREILAQEQDELAMVKGEFQRQTTASQGVGAASRGLGDEEQTRMSVAEGQDRIQRIAKRMEKVEEFMQEAMQYASFRSKDVRNRMAVIEDLIRGQRDATLLKVEREIWESMPPRLGDRGR